MTRAATTTFNLTARLALAFIGATLVTFVISHLIPSDVARMIAGDGASPQVLAHIRQTLGLDEPLWKQYLIYLAHLVHGDLGVSIRTGEPVAVELARAIPATAELALAAFALIVVLSLGLGCAAALRRDGPLDHAVRMFSSLAVSTPTFWTGLLLIGLFSAALGWLPSTGRLSPDLAEAPRITGLVTLDAILTGRPDVLLDALAHLALPAITLALAFSGASIRLVRASMLEVLSADYVRRARAAGLSEWMVVTRYALPNALIPFVTTLGIGLADLLAGAVITESIFGWPGLGSYTLGAIAGLDFPAIMGFTLFAALAYSSANIMVEGIVGALDPRARRA